MTTSELLNLDYRDKENKQIIQKALSKVKPLSKYSDEKQVPIEAIEKLVHLVCYRYQIWVRSISLDSQANEDYDVLRCEVIDETNLQQKQNIFGMCIYELYAKLVIYLWSEMKKESLKRRK